MLNLRIFFPTCAFLAVTCGSVFAATPGAAVLHSAAAVVNGEPVQRSTILFNGDNIETRSSAASLEMSGSAVLLDQNSIAVLQDNQLVLICGGAVIKTLNGLTARTGNLVIRPASHRARFEVVRTEKSLRVTALDGDLVISNENQNVSLKAGFRLEVVCSQCRRPANADQNTVLSHASDSCTLPAAITSVPATGPSLDAKILAGIAPASAIWPILLDTPVSPDHP